MRYAVANEGFCPGRQRFLLLNSSISLATGSPGNSLRSLTRERMVSSSTRLLLPRSDRGVGERATSCRPEFSYSRTHRLMVDAEILVRPEAGICHRWSLFSRIRSASAPGSRRVQTSSLMTPNRNRATSSRSFSCMDTSVVAWAGTRMFQRPPATIDGSIRAGLQHGRVVSARFDSPFCRLR